MEQNKKKINQPSPSVPLLSLQEATQRGKLGSTSCSLVIASESDFWFSISSGPRVTGTSADPIS